MIAVTGCGLVSSLGLDVVNACAASRAGIVRTSGMDVYPVRSSADGSVGGVVCHAVPLLTDGFEGEARLVRLVQGGLEDLARQCMDAPWKTRRTAFYLSVPSLERLATGAELVAEEGKRQQMQELAKEKRDPVAGFERAGRLLSQGARLAHWSGKPELKWCTDSGHTGVAEAMRRASTDLQGGGCDLAIVGGVDSYLDEDTLAWLELTGRLKTPDRANGLQPGEACGFLLLETEESAAKRMPKRRVCLDAVCLEEEAMSLVSGGQSSGVALAEVVHHAASVSSWGREAPARISHDLNGETYRAHEWGLALLRLAARSKVLAEPEVWFPSASFGSTGAATGAVQACVAAQAYARPHLSAKPLAVVSSADGRPRGCFVLQPKAFS